MMRRVILWKEVRGSPPASAVAIWRGAVAQAGRCVRLSESWTGRRKDGHDEAGRLCFRTGMMRRVKDGQEEAGHLLNAVQGLAAGLSGGDLAAGRHGVLAQEGNALARA